MEMKILEEKENQFFGRKDLKISLEHTGSSTVAKELLVKEISEKFSVPQENIVVDYLVTRKGTSSSEARVKVYKEKPKVKEKKEKKEEKSEAPATETR